jgi:hypothetical protein
MKPTGFIPLGGLLSHRTETCALRVWCIPATAPGTGCRVTGTVWEMLTQGLPVTNPKHNYESHGRVDPPTPLQGRHQLLSSAITEELQKLVVYIVLNPSVTEQ